MADTVQLTKLSAVTLVRQDSPTQLVKLAASALVSVKRSDDTIDLTRLHASLLQTKVSQPSLMSLKASALLSIKQRVILPESGQLLQQHQI